MPVVAWTISKRACSGSGRSLTQCDDSLSAETSSKRSAADSRSTLISTSFGCSSTTKGAELVASMPGALAVRITYSSPTKSVPFRRTTDLPT